MFDKNYFFLFIKVPPLRDHFNPLIQKNKLQSKVEFIDVFILILYYDYYDFFLKIPPPSSSSS